MLVWFIDLRDRLPVVAVPLRSPFPDVPLDLQKVLDEVYERACYADQVDYTRMLPNPDSQTLHDLPGICDSPSQGAGGDHGRAGQIDRCVRRSHPPPEVPAP